MVVVGRDLYIFIVMTSWTEHICFLDSSVLLDVSVRHTHMISLTISFNARASMLCPTCLRRLDSDRVSRLMISRFICLSISKPFVPFLCDDSCHSLGLRDVAAAYQESHKT